MFENLSYLSLQQYWWAIVSLLGALFVFLSFVQGGQSLMYQVSKTEKQRLLCINTLGRKWEFTFTTLVTFGGAFFASFPLFYATSFGGAYWVWIAILICFVIQAVSYEYRRKPGNLLGQKTYETFLIINGILAPILIGTAVGTFFNGAEFILDENKVVHWQNGARGLEAVLTFHNVALGLSVFFLARVLGALYFINSVDNSTVYKLSKRQVLLNALPFLVFFLYFLIALLLKDGYAYNSLSDVVQVESFKYWHNLLEMPFLLALLLVGVLAVLWGIASTALTDTRQGIWSVGAGTVAVVWTLFLMAGLNNTSFYPSLVDIQSSLTIENASSSRFTLTVMSYVSLLVPFVLAYIWWFWRAMNNKKISDDELDEHAY
ncbi:MAG: cytochrome d ubiquinol oxidase subunit II [Mangrovibacterium sp.]